MTPPRPPSRPDNRVEKPSLPTLEGLDETDPEDTPRPDVFFARELQKDEALARDVGDWISGKKEEQRKGYTLEKLFLKINERDGKTSKSISEIQRWQLEHDQLHEGLRAGLNMSSQPAITVIKPSIPPMRNVADTGSFRLNDAELEAAKKVVLAEFEEATRKNAEAFEKYKAEQAAERAAEKVASLVAENADLKDQKQFLGRTALDWTKDAFMVVFAAFVGFMISLLTHAK